MIIGLTLVCATALAKKKPKEEVFSMNINGLILDVVSKSCDGNNLPLNGHERIQTANGLLVLISQASENESQICNRAIGMDRLILSSSYDNKSMTEMSQVTSRIQRLVCRDKQTSTVVSDENSDIEAKTMMAHLSLSKEAKSLSLKASEQCPNGILKMELTEKKN